MGLERVLRLEGARNFRDLGGYPTRDGRRLKWRHLYRAGVLQTLTPVDCERIGALGIRSICDLRGTAERRNAQWLHSPRVTYWARDYVNSVANLYALLKSPATTVEEARAAMIANYRVLPSEQAPAYREIFRLLAAGELPLVINCSAGKDRTGLAAALVLSALGVAPEVILEDYLLSNTHFTMPREQLAIYPCSAEVQQILVGTEASFLAAAFSTIHDTHGSIDAYLRDELQVSDEMLTAIQARLLELAP